MKLGRKTSILWSYFTYISESTAICDICNHKLSYKSTTTNLRKHLERKHNINSYKPREGVTYILARPGMKDDETCRYEELVEVDSYPEVTGEISETPGPVPAVTHDSSFDHKYASEKGLTIVVPGENVQPGSSCGYEGSVKHQREISIKIPTRESVDSGICKKMNTPANIKPEDEFDVAGKKLAYDLRTMSCQQRVFAEKLLSDIMYYAKLGRLDENSSIKVG